MTQGIPDVYAKLQEIIGAPVNLSAVQDVTRSPQEDGRSFVGMFLKRLSPDGFTATVDQADLIQGLLEALHHGWVSEAGPGMRHGVWEHFKGNLYCSLGVGLNTETDAQEVEYLSMDGTKFHRRCEQWNEIVQWPDGKYRSRFVWRGSPYSRPRSQSPSVRYTPIILDQYLRLESTMVEFEAGYQVELAEQVREIMDTLWWQLSPDDRDTLNNRILPSEISK